MDDTFGMTEALKEAHKALDIGEIPVGAVVVQNNVIIGRGYNRRALDDSPFCHAEMAAMKAASERLHCWRFDGCTIYVTLEPCVMCAGAIVQCRMSRLVFGTDDPKAGAAGSLYNIPSDPRMYHQCAITSGIMKDKCAELLRRYFRNKRSSKNV